LNICAVEHAGAQPFPNKPIKIIEAFPAGGPIGALARFLANELPSRLQQPVIFENRPGGGGSIGYRSVATADPDGYTLLITGQALPIAAALYKNFEVDPIKSFTPVAMVATSPWVLVVTPSLPVRSLREFIAFAKTNPGKLNTAYGVASAPHLLSELFKIVTGTDIVSVPYKGGNLATTDLISGQVHMAIGSPGTLLPLIQDGKVRALAVTSATRTAELPEVPTMRESGITDFPEQFWSGLLAPAGTPTAIVNRLNTDVNEILHAPELKASMSKLGFEPRTMSPQDFAAFVAADTRKWADIVKSTGVKVD
jgi:tripartite-type tricarboxylate transporter receptor subunit TctC